MISLAMLIAFPCNSFDCTPKALHEKSTLLRKKAKNIPPLGTAKNIARERKKYLPAWPQHDSLGFWSQFVWFCMKTMYPGVSLTHALCFTLPFPCAFNCASESWRPSCQSRHAQATCWYMPVWLPIHCQQQHHSPLSFPCYRIAWLLLGRQCVLFLQRLAVS